MLSKAFWKVCKNGASKAHEIETIGCQQIKTYTPCTCNFNVSWPKNFPLCCNPSFGLATKARACKVMGQEGSLGVTSHAPKSAKECEGMNLHTPNWTFILGVGVPMDSRIFRGQMQGLKPIELKSYLYLRKAIET